MKDPIGRPPETKYGSVFFTLIRLASLDRRALLRSGISEHEEKHVKEEVVWKKNRSSTNFAPTAHRRSKIHSLPAWLQRL
jgi:hypothetical protein